ncbi:MAG: hypothetical protein ACO3RB_00485 [Ilumatobacteraceae bacterium]
MTRHRRRKHGVLVAALAVVVVLSGCGGGGSPKVAELTAVAADSGLVPVDNGFSFANFPATATQAWFNENDLVTMFGGAACVDGVTVPCVPTAQAAQWAQMVNEARMSGHCEGLAVQSAVRFTDGATPKTVELRNEGDVTHGIMRAFATQFFPEVQKASNEWAKKSLNDILNELSRGFAAKDVSYTMGLYTPTGGHAVLPYAIEFSGENLAVVKVYDSNWPGMERYVVIDLAAQTWFFSFSASDPQKDECAWTGKAGDLDIAPMSARTEAQCPFCGDDTQVTKNVLLIRSASLDWTLKTAEGTFSPADATAVPDDVRARAIRTASCEVIVRIPEFVLYTETDEFELELPDTASAYVSTPDAVVKVETDGKKTRKPIVFSDKRVKTDDESTVLTVASDNAVARVEVPTSEIVVSDNLVTVNTNEGDVATTSEAPQIVVTTGGGSSAPVAKPVENLVTVVPEVKPELVPEQVKPGLTETTARDLSNEAYAASVAATPVVPVSVPPVTTTTVAEQRNVAAPAATTTTVRSTTTTRPAVTTTTRPGATTTVGATTPVTAVAVTTTTVQSTTTTTRATTTTVSPTTTRATTTTTQPVPQATFKVVMSSSSSTLRIDMGSSTDSWDQRYGGWSCSGNDCDGATASVPLGNYVFVRVQNAFGGYVNFGVNFGSSYIQNNDMYYAPTEQRRCGPNWSNFSNNTCTFYVFPP